MKRRAMRSGAISRRRFLQGAALGAAWAAARPVISSALATPSERQTVAVFGGGFAGLTAAHELAERGFDVTVYERRAWGGKARSYEIPGTAAGGRKPLPGEHGLRVWFGFYQNTVETFRKIPFPSNPNGVFDNLTGFHQVLFARDEGRRDVWIPLGVASERMAVSPATVVDTVTGLLLRETFLEPRAVAFLAQRLAVYFSSCDARRIGQWDETVWTEFAGANRFNDDYRKLIVNGFSEWVQASKAEHTSANFCAKVLEWFVYNDLRRHANGTLARTFDRPTNEALIDPWVAELERLGVDLRLGHEIVGFGMRDGAIAGATVRHAGRTSTVDADWYVCALPVERARALWSDDILEADPALAGMFNLDTAWMNGLKLFLREYRPLVNGIYYCADSPWLLGGGSQAVFWRDDFASKYGDGGVRDCHSIVISRWTEPGILYGKPASDCTEEEIATEVWEQLKRHVNDSRKTELTDDMLHSWDIDQGMLRQNGRLVSDDPLVLPTAGQRRDRPDVTTAIPNLFLAGDYLKSSWEVANMETASYNGRRAANAILERAGSSASPAAAIEPIRPQEWEPLKRIDEQRYRRGEPNLFDSELSPAALSALLRL